MTAPINDPGDPTSWRPSVSSGGSPGASDTQPFIGDPAADDDGDGLSALLEHAHGTSDAIATAPGDLFVLERESSGSLVISFQRNLAAGGLNWSLERSLDLVSWMPADDDLQFLGIAGKGDGTANQSYRSQGDGSVRQFWRFRVTLDP